MGIKVKFLGFTVLISVLLALVSVIGYYHVHKQVTEDIAKNVLAVVDSEKNDIDGWLLVKAQKPLLAAQTIPATGGEDAPVFLLSCGKDDPDIQDFYSGDENGRFIHIANSAVPPDFDPRRRGWYKEAKAQNKLIFTDAYVDVLQGDMVVTAAVPFRDAAGAARGVVAADISLDRLSKQVKDITLDGQGQGFIMDRNGMIIASCDESQTGKNISETDAAFKDDVPELQQKNAGLLYYSDKGEPMLLAYTKLRTTGWIVGLQVSENIIYGKLYSLMWKYIWLTLFGVLITLFIGWRFAGRLARQLTLLADSAGRVAQGDLRMNRVEFDSRDELGRLAKAFNRMADNLRDLIRSIAAASEQITSSSEQLTSGAEQSAGAANQVSESIVRVAEGMAAQMTTVDTATRNISSVVERILQVSDQAGAVSQINKETVTAAREGETALTHASEQMGSIEQTVTRSAEVVARLGASSKEIDQIVDVISQIAGQTNLLALNAAIEAARAGEQGRGFAVVAEEVRKLAEQSQEAAKKITQLIGDIQKDTEEAVAAMDAGTHEVRIGADVIESAVTTFKKILTMVDQMTGKMDEISASVQEAAERSRKIVHDVENISEVSKNASSQTQTISAASQEQSASVEEISTSTRLLTQMAQKMQETISKFKL